MEESSNKTYNYYYNIFHHKIWIVFCIIIVSLICFIVFPFFIKFLYDLFEKCIWEAEGYALDSLPDFFGGMCGIVIGFFIDGWLIDKIRHLTELEKILLGLNSELINIKNMEIQKPIEHICIVTDKIYYSPKEKPLLYNLPIHIVDFIRGIRKKKINDKDYESYKTILARRYNDVYLKIYEANLIYKKYEKAIVAKEREKLAEIWQKSYGELQESCKIFLEITVNSRKSEGI